MLLDSTQDVLRLLQFIMALSACSNRSLLKCAATLPGPDTQSEMETEKKTSCTLRAEATFSRYEPAHTAKM